MGIFAMVFVGFAVATISYLVVSRNEISQRQANALKVPSYLRSAIETFLLAYRASERKYIEEVAAQCAGAKTFFRALKEGADCRDESNDPVALMDISIFDSANDTGNTDLYSLPNPCVIQNTSSTCESAAVIRVDMTNPTHQIVNTQFEFYFAKVILDHQVVEFQVKYKDSGKQQKVTFAVRNSLANASHLEADGRVVQEREDLLSPCVSRSWGSYSFYNKFSRKCENFAQLGSGTGMHFFANRYFGFRPFDGQIVDLLALNLGTYMVNEDGTLDGVPIHPQYTKTDLINADDLTVIGHHIYFVKGLGISAALFALRNPSVTMPTVPAVEVIPICELGSMGWAQAYAGVGATVWSDPLLSEAGDEYPPDSVRVAQFFLKTDSGDMLLAVVSRTSNLNTFNCKVFKDASLQTVEYKRTLGFDRTETQRQYFIY